MHGPLVKRVRTLRTGTHSIRLRDPRGGELVIFVAEDWSDWDAIVAAVNAHRTEQQEV